MLIRLPCDAPSKLSSSAPTPPRPRSPSSTCKSVQLSDLKEAGPFNELGSWMFLENRVPSRFSNVDPRKNFSTVSRLHESSPMGGLLPSDIERSRLRWRSGSNSKVGGWFARFASNVATLLFQSTCICIMGKSLSCDPKGDSKSKAMKLMLHRKKMSMKQVIAAQVLSSKMLARIGHMNQWIMSMTMLAWAYGHGNGKSAILRAFCKLTMPREISWKARDMTGGGIGRTPEAMLRIVDLWIHWRITSTLSLDSYKNFRLLVSRPLLSKIGKGRSRSGDTCCKAEQKSKDMSLASMWR
mmetsp:Transcript_5215/g.14425  ORF Transcript_5215/g.14425 Transcript_5215/m.14425 type:complete len:297 (-) Transcript_5215:79-969(-)